MNKGFRWNWRGEMAKLLRYFLCLIMAVQILLGVLWMGRTIFSTFTRGLSDWHFAETDRFLQASSDWVLDEYMGVLYPAILAFWRWIFPSGIAFEGVVQLVQVTVSFLACMALLRVCGQKRGRAVFGALYLTTIPFNALLHTSLLPRSFLVSCLVLSLSLAVRAFQLGQMAAQDGESEKKMRLSLAGSLLLWSAMILLDPDYWWLGLWPVLFVCGCALRVQSRNFVRAFCLCLALLLAALLPVGVNRLVQTQGSGGRIQRSLASALVSRMVWPDFGLDYYFWPEEIKELFTEEELGTYSRADQVAEEFGPRVEAAYGLKEARRLYREMAFRCFDLRTKEKLTEIGQDFLAYFAAPWCVWKQLVGSWEGLSYSGWNYRIMTALFPVLTKWYVRAGYSGLCAGLAGALLLKILDRQSRKSLSRVSAKNPAKRGWPLVVLAVICVLWQAAWYTMSGAGMMDFCNVPGIFVFWYFGIPISLKTTSEEPS